MKNTIFLVAMACLLAGCAGKGPTVMKLKTEANVTSEHGLPVKVMSNDDKPLPIKIVPDEIAVGAFAASLIAVCATTFAAIAAWRAAGNTKRAAEGQLFVGLTREYVSDEIGKEIKELDDWWKKEGGAFKAIGEWREWINVEVTDEQRKKEAEEIQRRFGDKLPISKVAIYFLTILQLYKSGYVSKEFVRSICEITKITEGVEDLMERYIWANDGGSKKVEKFRNELKEIRHIEGA